MAVTKVINSESKQYKPVLTDKLVLDAVPTVNSLNAVTSDAVARAVAGASGEVPQVTENDNGKVLKAVYDASGPAVEWGEAAPAVDEVPDVTSSDDGKVLKATYSGGHGSYAWGNDSDTTYTAGNMIAINSANSNAIGVSTTAGVTDIQVVNALPASPVSTVLYLIPET